MEGKEAPKIEQDEREASRPGQKKWLSGVDVQALSIKHSAQLASSFLSPPIKANLKQLTS
jgi:hypothetical protein